MRRWHHDLGRIDIPRRAGQRHAVEVEDIVPQNKGVSWRPNDTLYQRAAAGFHRVEEHGIAALRPAKEQGALVDKKHLAIVIAGSMLEPAITKTGSQISGNVKEIVVV